MASWSQLPPNFKKSVVSHLDVFSRMRLKVCSTSDRKLVNSVPLIIKNARIGISDTLCFLTIHTGIDAFFKVEFELNGKGDIVHVRRSTSYKEDFKTVVLHCANLFLPTTAAILFLLISPTTILDSLEWELSHKKVYIELTYQLMYHLNGGKLRVKKLVFNRDAKKDFVKIVMGMCAKKYLKDVEKREVVPEIGKTVDPVFVMDSYYPEFADGMSLRHSRIYLKTEPIDYILHSLPVLLLAEKRNEVYMTYRVAHNNPQALFDKCNSETRRITPNIHVKREIHGEVVLRHTLTSCGYSISAIRRSYETSVDWKSESCGLAELCSKCSGTFSHCYFMDLPRRIVTEPTEWTRVFSPIPGYWKRQRVFWRLAKMVNKTPPMWNRISGAKWSAEWDIDPLTFMVNYTLFCVFIAIIIAQYFLPVWYPKLVSSSFLTVFTLFYAFNWCL